MNVVNEENEMAAIAEQFRGSLRVQMNKRRTALSAREGLRATRGRAVSDTPRSEMQSPGQFPLQGPSISLALATTRAPQRNTNLQTGESVVMEYNCPGLIGRRSAVFRARVVSIADSPYIIV
ncbi:hypothetical protein Bbelb_207930 [Branchiostoma belcheri]|nr:hypothetical protein Bbelb_207930 [Branchiostoma belcheri]